MTAADVSAAIDAQNLAPLIDPPPQSLYAIFREAAARYPDQVAVDLPPGRTRSQRVRLTYAELEQRAGRLARRLAERVTPDGICAILLPRDTVQLYVAQLAVLKAGAAFTCIDPAFPDDHLQDVLADADATVLIADRAGIERCASAGVKTPPIVDPDRLPFETSSGPDPVGPPSSANLAYVIYTSGTTGRPKGVMIEHRSIINLVMGDVDYFGLSSRDRVAQCSSPAYDSSIEETWLAFAVGAALVLLDDDAVRLGPDLVPWLARENVSVLCPTPTLLRTSGCLDPARALPDLRLLYVGGEALAPDLADRWSAGRWMENGYGPTECTVTVVRGPIAPGRPVTIGAPIRGCRADVLDEALRPVDDGVPGELCISGAGLARGYHKREALTAEKFPLHPKLGRIYRTGDLVRRNERGDFEYLGRIDAQVKLRGYRIELPAVEAVLASCPGVVAAGCKVQGEGAAQALIAHLVPERFDAPPSLEDVKARLQRALPAYMTPSRFAFVEQLPTTVGGKLDRKALPDIAAPARSESQPSAPPRTEDEIRIADAFRRALRLTGEISIHDDFFKDLGGDSLSAVEVVCELRDGDGGGADPQTGSSRATVRDIYEARTVAGMAALPKHDPEESPLERSSAARPHGRPLRSTMIQTLWLALEFVVGGASTYGLAALLTGATRQGGVALAALAAAAVVALGVLIYIPVIVAWTALLKRILIGRYHPLRAPVWGSFYTRHWIVVSAARLIPWPLLYGTPLAAVVLRALGARVGRRVHIHRGVDLARGGWDLLTLEDDVTLAQDASLRLVELEDGDVVVGSIWLGAGATVDVRAGLGPHSAMEAGAHLTPLSALASGARIPRGDRWDGVPAAPAGRAPPAPVITRSRGLSPRLYGLVATGTRLAGAVAAVMTPWLIGLAFWMATPGASEETTTWLETPRVTGPGLALACLLASCAVAAALLVEALACRLLGRIAPGVISQFSLEAMRVWAKTGIVMSAGRWLSGSMLWPWWLRLAGMRIARGCEISTIIDVIPETVTLGPESFFADGIYFCGPWRHRGAIVIGATVLGARTFLGNHAVVPAGHVWPDELFVGVSTRVDPEQALRPSAWFGHPPMELPRRDVVEADRRLTYEPGALRVLTRLFWELLRLALPSMPIALGCAWYLAISVASRHVGELALGLAIAPMLALASAAGACLGVVALKWCLLGRMRPGQHAFWSCWCGRWDFLFMAWGYLARPWLSGLEGTLWLNGYLRLTGVKLGRRVVLGRGFSQVVDPDMLEFADDATVTCHLQAHSFEDRILKLDKVRIGRAATVGDNAVVFYGADIGERATVEPHSVVMKRDQLRPGVRYEGCPTQPARRRALLSNAANAELARLAAPAELASDVARTSNRRR